MLNVNALGLPFKPLVCNHPAPVMDGCVLYLDGRYGCNDPATQTWYDLSGMGNDGVLSNFAFAGTSGWTGRGLQFDGVDDYVDCGNNGSLTPNYITIDFSLTLRGIDDNSGIFSKGDGLNRMYWMWIYGGNYRFNIGSGENFSSNITPVIGEKRHFTITYDGSSVKVYVDGVLDTNIPQQTGVLAYNEIPLKLGYLTGHDNAKHGNFQIEFFRIYNRALSDREITQNYLATKCIMPLSHVAGAVLDLRGREGTNTPATTVWQDASGHGNNAELKNVAYTAGDGWTGDGLELDGVDSYGDCDVPDSFLADCKHTVEMWCNPADLGAYRGFIEVANKDDVNGSNGNRVGRIMSFGNNAVMYHAIFAIFGSDLPPVEITLPLNEMVHLVGTYNGSTAKLYVNGVLKGSSSGVASVSIPAGKRILFVGRDLVPDRCYKGTIHNVRIYPKALTDSEVLQNYLATVNRHLFA